MNLISTLTHDLKHLATVSESSSLRSFFTLSFFSVFLFRMSRSLYYSPLRFFSIIPSLFNILLFSVEISPRVRIKPGLVLPHPNSIIIGAYSIGKNCIIYQQTTLGTKAYDSGFNRHKRPKVGDNVIIGCGCAILGDVSIKSFTTASANSLVL